MNKSFFVKLLLVLLFVITPSFVSADSGNMGGWAWSDTIGWISFTSRNDHNPSMNGVQPHSIEYGVTENGDGTLTGWAWSEHIGWIKFGGLGGFPATTGTEIAQNAKLNATGQLQGWIRACAGTVNGDCNSLSRTDGWDGWISLWGTGYGVTKDLVTGEYKNFAWGDVNVGWILFDVQNARGSNPPPTPPPTGCLGVCGPGAAPIIAFDVKDANPPGLSLNSTNFPPPNNVPVNTTPRFEWTVQNLLPGDSCAINGSVPVGVTAFSKSPITSSGFENGAQLSVTGTYTYTMTCTEGTTRSVTFIVSTPVTSGFSLGNPQDVKIQFIGTAPYDSELKEIKVYPYGGFDLPVTITVDGVVPPPALPAGVTFTYSLNSGAFNSRPSVVVSPNNGVYPPVSFRVRSTGKFTDKTNVRILGQEPSKPDATVIMRIDPTSGKPIYQEF